MCFLQKKFNIKQRSNFIKYIFKPFLYFAREIRSTMEFLRTSPEKLYLSTLKRLNFNECEIHDVSYSGENTGISNKYKKKYVMYALK